MKQIIVCLLLIATGSRLWAQEQNCNLTLSGIVIDTLDNTPLSQTKISLLGLSNLSTISDKNGRFTLKNICPGTNELHVSHLNCEHIHLKIDLNRDTEIVIYIRHMETSFPDAKKTAFRQKVDPSQVSKDRLESTRSNGIGSVFKEITGVTLVKTGSSISKPMVNGLHSNRVLIINNGIRQEGQNWGMEHAPEIDPFLASEVSLLKGANSLRYGGDGIGGVLLVNPPSLFKEKSKTINGELIGAGFSNGRGGIISAYAGYKISDNLPLYMRMQGTMKRSGNVKAPDYYLNNTGIDESNYSINLGYSRSSIRTEVFYSDFRTKLGIFSGSHIGNLQDLNIAMQSSRPLSPDVFSYTINRPFQKVEHKLLKAKTNWYKDAFNSFELNLSQQINHREEYDVLRSSASSTGPAFDYWIRTSMMDLQWRRLDAFGFTVQLGTQALYQANAYQGRFFIPGFYQKGIGEYLILEKKQGRNELEIGTRYDNRLYDYYLWNNGNLTVEKKSFQGLSFVLRDVIQTNKAGKFGINLSSTWRPASANELYANGLHQGIASIEIGDPSIRRERAYSSSIEHTIETKKLLIQSEILYKYVSGFINLIPGKEPVLTIRGAFPTFYYKQQEAMIYGLNINFRYAINDFYSFKFKGEFLNGLNQSQNDYLNQMPPYTSAGSFNYARKNLKINFEADYTFKQFRYEDQSDYLPPPPAYLLFNAELRHEFKIGKQSINWSFQINNILNKRYREYLNRFRYYTDAQGRNLTINIQIPLKIITTSKS